MPFVRVHAAEALIGHGQREGLKKQFTKELALAEPVPAIGMRRVLARLAVKPAERKKLIQEIRQIFLDSTGSLQVNAVETLAKLNYVPSNEDQELKRVAAKEKEAGAAYARWCVANSGKDEDINSLADLLKTPNPDVKAGAAYALRHQKQLPSQALAELQSAVKKEPADSPAKVYLASAWFVHAPHDQRTQALDQLLPFLGYKTKEQPYEVAAALAQVGDYSDQTRLISLLDHPELDVRVSAANALLRISRRWPHQCPVGDHFRHPGRRSLRIRSRFPS